MGDIISLHPEINEHDIEVHFEFFDKSGAYIWQAVVPLFFAEEFVKWVETRIKDGEELRCYGQTQRSKKAK